MLYLFLLALVAVLTIVLSIVLPEHADKPYRVLDALFGLAFGALLLVGAGYLLWFVWQVLWVALRGVIAWLS